MKNKAQFKVFFAILIGIFSTALLPTADARAEAVSSYSSMPSDRTTLFPFFTLANLTSYGISREIFDNGSGTWMPWTGFPDGLTGFFASDTSSTIAPFGQSIDDLASRYTFSSPVYAVGFTLIATNYPNTDNPSDSFDDNVENVSYQVTAYDVDGNEIGSTESSSYGHVVGPIEFHTTFRGTEFMASYAGLSLDKPIHQLTIMARRPAYDQAMLAEMASFSFSSTPLDPFMRIAQLVPCAGPVSGGAWKNHGQYVSRVARVATQFLLDGLITQEEMGVVVSDAAGAFCGK